MKNHFGQKKKKVFVLRLFKMATNQTENSKLESLVAENYKPYEIY